MPTLLMLSYYFPPSASAGVFRLLGFARHLPKFGWNAAVVAPPELPWEPNDPALVERIPADVKVFPVPYPRAAPKALRWLMPYGVWLLPARAAARRAAEEVRPDAVLTSGPAHWVHLLGRDLQKRYGLPWLADFRDPWVTSSFLPYMAGFQRFWQGIFEARVMRHADRIVHNTPRACSLVEAAYPRHAGRMCHLYNGYDPEAFDDAPEYRREGPVRVAHIGQLYMGRDPRPILDAVASIGPDEAPPFVLDFFGRTDFAPDTDLAAEAKKRGLEGRVTCGSQIGYRESLAKMRAADVLLLMEPEGRDLGVPAKLFEYLGAGRPILAAAGTSPDLEPVLSASGTPYRLTRCGDVAGIRRALLELVGGVATGALASGPAEGRLAFTREAMSGRLAKMLDELVARR